MRGYPLLVYKGFKVVDKFEMESILLRYLLLF